MDGGPMTDMLISERGGIESPLSQPVLHVSAGSLGNPVIPESDAPRLRRRIALAYQEPPVPGTGYNSDGSVCEDIMGPIPEIDTYLLLGTSRRENRKILEVLATQMLTDDIGGIAERFSGVIRMGETSPSYDERRVAAAPVSSWRYRGGYVSGNPDSYRMDPTESAHALEHMVAMDRAQTTTIFMGGQVHHT